MARLNDMPICTTSTCQYVMANDMIRSRSFGVWFVGLLVWFFFISFIYFYFWSCVWFEYSNIMWDIMNWLDNQLDMTKWWDIKKELNEMTRHLSILVTFLMHNFQSRRSPPALCWLGFYMTLLLIVVCLPIGQYLHIWAHNWFDRIEIINSWVYLQVQYTSWTN